MTDKTEICKNCSKTLSKSQVCRGGKYCLSRCYADSRWGKQMQFGKTLTRSKAFIEVAKLCQQGLTQTEVAQLLGYSRLTIAGWFVKYGSENILENRVCSHCGKSLSGMKYLSKRKYCSRLCASRAKYIRDNPIPKLMKFNPELRARGLELYWGGLEGKLIGHHLGIAEGTVHCWIHYFGHLRKRHRNPEALALLPVDIRLWAAKSLREWQKILRQNAPQGEEDIIQREFDEKRR